MGYGLAEAAKAVGVNKSTLFRAIKSGRLSATRRDDGAYDIDPAELHRAFPPVADAPRDLQRSEADLLRREIELLRERIADLVEDRDRWREQATRLLPAPQSTTRRRWWPFRR